MRITLLHNIVLNLCIIKSTQLYPNSSIQLTITKLTFQIKIFKKNRSELGPNKYLPSFSHFLRHRLKRKSDVVRGNKKLKILRKLRSMGGFSTIGEIRAIN